MYKVKNSLAPEHVCNIFFSKISIITYAPINVNPVGGGGGGMRARGGDLTNFKIF